jgi:serine/threonine-protein kinase
VTLIAGAHLGAYVIAGQIGAGGMGEVYRARDTRLGRDVAIKILPESMAGDSERLRRFEHEAKTLAALNHPNIVTIHALEEANGVLFLAMELVDGTPLSRLIPATGLALESFLEVALPLCEGLAAAHERGIIHRDLKPANVMVTPDRRVKVLDFGLARRTSFEESATEVRTAGGFVVGTLPYMSPEQISGGALDHRTDIYSLGVILHEMATGSRPAGGSISAARPDFPRGVREVIARAIERAPAARFQNVRDLQRALRQTPDQGEEIRSIAVMPLDNLSRDPAQEYFADGVTEALITDLAKITGLRVISRMSVMRYRAAPKALPDVARELGVDAIVEGSILTVGSRLRLTAKLVDAREDRHLWAERYDREMHDVFLLQDELVRAIAGEVKAKIHRDAAPPRRRVDPEVYHLDLKGRHLWNRRTEASFRAGLKLFEQAIAIDPEYAPAHIGVADCYAMLCNYGILPPSAGHPAAKAAIHRALDLDPSSGDAHRTLALTRWMFEFDWKGAEESYRKALELHPANSLTSYWYGAMLGVSGKQFEGLELLKRAQELDPLSLVIPSVQGWTYYFARQYDEAVARCRRVLEIDPEFMAAHWFLGQALIETGQHDQAIRELETAIALAGPRSRLTGYLGYALGRAGRQAEARAKLAELDSAAREHYVPPYFFALIHAGLAETDRACDRLEEAWNTRDVMLRDLLVDAAWDRMRAEPRFAALMEKMNYPER